MADWDEEGFEVPDLQAASLKPSIPKSWDDDEEDLLQKEIEAKLTVRAPTAAEIEAAKKKAIEDERALQQKIKLSLLEKESLQERKMREKQQAEDADNQIANELFGGATAKDSNKASSESNTSITVLRGIASTTLKTKQDHVNFGLTVSQKLAESSPFNIAAFYKSLAKTLEVPAISSEIVEEILAEIKRIKEEKLKIEKPAVKAAVVKKSKKNIVEEEKKHADKFGSAKKNDLLDKYDHYSNLEDDFM